MEENMIGAAAEINSIAYLNKKRKSQEIPLTKHVCWGQKLEHDSSSAEQKKARSSIFARGESIPENAKDSYSFHSNPETSSSVEASTSSGSRNGNSSEIGLYSLESRSLTKAASSIKSPCDNNEDHLLEFGNHADYCSCSEHQTDKDLDEMLYSNGVAPSNYVLSSGRCPVNQDAQQGTRKPTIDKEFEEYFSMLML